MSVEQVRQGRDSEQPASPEQREQLPYGGQQLDIFGGTSGTGEAIATEFAKLGGALTIYTSQQVQAETGEIIFPAFDAASRRFKRKGVDLTHVAAAYLNLKQPETVRPVLTERWKTNGVPQHIVNAAAGGMDSFALAMFEHLEQMVAIKNGDDPNKEIQIEQKIGELHNKLDAWLPASQDEAIAINFASPIEILETLAEMSHDKQVDAVFLNSTFGYTGFGPRHYENVALKVLTTEWLRAHAQRLMQQGVFPGEIVAPVIEDTKVGTIILEYMLPFMPEDVQEAVLNTKVKRKDVVEAVKQFWDMSEKERAQGPHPYTLFVTRHQGELIIAQEMPRVLLGIDPRKFRF